MEAISYPPIFYLAHISVVFKRIVLQIQTFLNSVLLVNFKFETLPFKFFFIDFWDSRLTVYSSGKLAANKQVLLCHSCKQEHKCQPTSRDLSFSDASIIHPKSHQQFQHDPFLNKSFSSLYH